MENGKIARSGRAAELIALCAVFCLLFAFSAMTPILADDYIFSLNRATWARLKRFGEIFESLWYLRSSVDGNGRVFAHFFAQLFLLLPKWVFNIANSACGAFTLYLIYRIVRGESARRNAGLLVLALSLVWLLTPAWGQVCIWLTGACNYGWGIMFLLLFLTPFFAEFLEKPGLSLFKGKSAAGKGVYIFLSFIAGGYSENGSFSALLIAFLLLALIYRRDKKIPKSLLPAFLAACAGMLFLMLCPAELLGRTGSAGDSTFARNLAEMLGRLGGRFGAALLALPAAAALGIYGCVKSARVRRLLFAIVPAAAFAALVYLLWPENLGDAGLFYALAALLSSTKLSVVAMFFLSYFLIYLAVIKRADRRTITLAAVLLTGAAASILIFTFAAYFPPRSAAYASVYTAIADLLALDAVREKGGKRFFTAAAAAGAVLLALTLAPAAKDVADSTALGRERQELFEAASAEGQLYVTVEGITPKTKYSPYWPGDADYFTGDISLYYGFGNVWINNCVLKDETILQ